MNHYPDSVINLIHSFSKLPGIGQKTAERLAFYILKANLSEAEELSDNIINLKRRIRLCKKCFSMSDHEICTICNDPARKPDHLCIVETPSDMIAIEKSGAYKGLYHILGGVLSPMDGIGPDDLRIKELIRRIGKEKINEIIIATGTDVEGETTASYISESMKTFNIKTTRIASGVPIGGSLKYIDQVTLKRALDGRHDI